MLDEDNDDEHVRPKKKLALMKSPPGKDIVARGGGQTTLILNIIMDDSTDVDSGEEEGLESGFEIKSEEDAQRRRRYEEKRAVNKIVDEGYMSSIVTSRL